MQTAFIIVVDIGFLSIFFYFCLTSKKEIQYELYDIYLLENSGISYLIKTFFFP